MPNTACLRGQACGWSARAEWPVSGESWNCLLEAAGAFVVALAARRPWFCCHRLVAVLARFGRRGTGRADVGALGRAFSRARALAGGEARARSPLCGPPAGPG